MMENRQLGIYLDDCRDLCDIRMRWALRVISEVYIVASVPSDAILLQEAYKYIVTHKPTMPELVSANHRMSMLLIIILNFYDLNDDTDNIWKSATTYALDEIMFSNRDPSDEAP